MTLRLIAGPIKDYTNCSTYALTNLHAHLPAASECVTDISQHVVLYAGHTRSSYIVDPLDMQAEISTNQYQRHTGGNAQLHLFTARNVENYPHAYSLVTISLESPHVNEHRLAISKSAPRPSCRLQLMVKSR